MSRKLIRDLLAGPCKPLQFFMRVLVACEFSGIVREAFKAAGADAWSCDLLPSDIPGKHIQGDVIKILGDKWDLMIAHPPCTHLAICGAPSFFRKVKAQAAALQFVRELLSAPISKICIENPVSVISSRIRPPDQIIHPYYFGDPVPKRTCLWLKKLPPLQWFSAGSLFPVTEVKPKFVVYKSKSHRAGTSKYPLLWGPGRFAGKERSRFFPGIARAMAAQWI